MTQDFDLIDLMVRQNWRYGDPDTSKEAGKAATFAKGDCADILKVMKIADTPLAGEEIADRLRWGNHVRVMRRTSELVDAGLIRRTDQRYINRSGRSAFKYEVIQ